MIVPPSATSVQEIGRRVKDNYQIGRILDDQPTRCRIEKAGRARFKKRGSAYKSVCLAVVSTDEMGVAVDEIEGRDLMDGRA